MISRRILQRGAQVRLFHTKPIARGGGHGSGLHFEPGPTTDEFGRLGNIPKGQKWKPTYGEVATILGMFFGMSTLFVGLMYKPDYELRAWGMQEYIRRVKARGETTHVERMEQMMRDNARTK